MSRRYSSRSLTVLKAIVLSIIVACFVPFALPARAEAPLCSAFIPQVRAHAAAGATGIQRVLWYRLSPAGETRPTAMPEQIDAVMQFANEMLQRNSYGKASLTWTITPVLQLPRTASYYIGSYFTLISDARAAAAAAGFNFADFDRDALAPPSIPGWPSGMADIGGRWMYIGAIHGGLIMHELGHTFGLSHANARVTTPPDTAFLQWPPFPSNIDQISPSLPFERNSVIGFTGVLYAGSSSEYGDPFDIMGPAVGDFQVESKKRLGWIASSQVTNVTRSGVYRIFSPSATAVQTGRICGIQIDRPVVGRQDDGIARFYSIQIDNTRKGLLLRWTDGAGANLLVHATPGLNPRFESAALPIGRAFDDPRLALTIKPLAAGTTDEDQWIDVSIDFNAGDKEADNPSILPDFGVPIEYLEVFQIRGRVTDQNGDPIANCRVHNGGINTPFSSTQTDRNGNYTLQVIDKGPFTVGVSAYGYTAAAGSSEQLVTIPPTGAATANFTLRALPRVTVAAAPQAFEGDTLTFTIHRSGPTTEPLEVAWQLTGAADAADLSNNIRYGSAAIPIGSAETTVSIPTRIDSAPELPETVTLHAIAPSIFDRAGVLFSYPGWELRGVSSSQHWAQTDPPFATFADASATVTIIDASVTPALRFIGGADPSLQSLELIGPANTPIRIDSSIDLRTWQPAATNMSGTIITVPFSNQGARFYRAQTIN